MLTEVLKEREAQIELKRLKALASDGKDVELFRQAQREHEEAIIKDQAKAMERIMASKSTAQFQKSQSVLFI